MAIFKERLRQIRKEKELTQKQLAEIIGSHEIVIQQYELGKRKPAHDAIINLSRRLRVSADWLLGLSEDPAIHSPSAPDSK